MFIASYRASSSSIFSGMLVWNVGAANSSLMTDSTSSIITGSYEHLRTIERRIYASMLCTALATKDTPRLTGLFSLVIIVTLASSSSLIVILVSFSSSTLIFTLNASGIYQECSRVFGFQASIITCISLNASGATSIHASSNARSSGVSSPKISLGFFVLPYPEVITACLASARETLT